DDPLLAHGKRSARDASRSQPLLVSDQAGGRGVHAQGGRPRRRPRAISRDGPAPLAGERPAPPRGSPPWAAPPRRRGGGRRGRRSAGTSRGQARRETSRRGHRRAARPVLPPFAAFGMTGSAGAPTRLSIRREGPVLRIALSRPEVRNAFDDALIAELTEAFTGVSETSDARVVILQGEGPSFCAGADIAWMRNAGTYSKAENEADAG